jgi:hypothetical protein
VLTFLIVIFLAIGAANTVMVVIVTMKMSGGELHLCVKKSSASGSLTNTRGIHSLRRLSVHDQLCGRFAISGFHDLDTCHCVGGSCSVSRSLDYYKAIP